MLAETSQLSRDFVELERDFIRDKLLPDFDYTTFEIATGHNKLAKKLSDARVGLVSTCGLHLKSQEPFTITSPQGDDSFRKIPLASQEDDYQLSHPGYNTALVAQDVNVVFPITRLKELLKEKFISSLSPFAYTFMGYIPRPQKLMNETIPLIVEEFKNNQVDVVLLVPA